jgi:hypothetical protein
MEDMSYKIGALTGGYFPFGGFTAGALGTGGYTGDQGGYSGDISSLVIGGEVSWLSGDDGM